MSSKFDKIKNAWKSKMSEPTINDWSKAILKGEMKICHYKGYLQETYHHTKWNPQLQAYCTMFIKNYPRDIFKLFYRHAISEINHDLMALDDLCNLGADREKVQASKPLPETVSLNAFPTFLMQFDNPLSYLGYLFHLEVLPTQSGRSYIEALKKVGVPDNALTFLQEHATVDEGHVKMMEKYVETLIVTPDDLDAVSYAMEGTAVMQSHFIRAAFKNGEKIYD